MKKIIVQYEPTTGQVTLPNGQMVCCLTIMDPILMAEPSVEDIPMTEPLTVKQLMELADKGFDSSDIIKLRKEGLI